jgi:hypothetical protein
MMPRDPVRPARPEGTDQVKTVVVGAAFQIVATGRRTTGQRSTGVALQA